MTHSIVEAVTAGIAQRSVATRAAFLERCARSAANLPPRRSLSCGNLAHGFAACSAGDKQTIRLMDSANLGIVTAYNDMLSAHQPLANYPDLIKRAAREAGSSAQVAGGVPAMCDGVTQGQPGMELSLLSRDVIAMATAIALSHNLFDGVLCLGVCDKIVPGMLIGALAFAHLPAGFIPAGPMPSGLSNPEKAAVRQRYAEGKADRETLLDAESASYHSPGTCTFYGTANSNQVMVELLGVQLPGASFVNPEDPLRAALTRETVLRTLDATSKGRRPVTLADMITPAALVNAVVGLLATGGSTNHTLHLVAIARAAGVQLEWSDFDALARVVPLLARVYPNGVADINHFQHAGGMAYLVRELRDAGLLNESVRTLMGEGLAAYALQPALDSHGNLHWTAAPAHSRAPDVLAPVAAPFDSESGLHRIHGQLGEGIIKVSAVRPEHRSVRAPCRIFADQNEVKAAFDAGELNRDVVVVVRFQGPANNGMPELHKLTPYLGLLQDRGHNVALITDGRMSGASGKVPAAIHLTPEAAHGGPLARLQDGDVIALDADAGSLQVDVDPQTWAARTAAAAPVRDDTLGRHLFARLRASYSGAAVGASVFAD